MILVHRKHEILRVRRMVKWRLKDTTGEDHSVRTPEQTRFEPMRTVIRFRRRRYSIGKSDLGFASGVGFGTIAEENINGKDRRTSEHFPDRTDSKYTTAMYYPKGILGSSACFQVVMPKCWNAAPIPVILIEPTWA